MTATKHLAQGSRKPPKIDGKLRLYSMEFCPYALRARLILLVKQVPHDIVNIHLKNKPDWYLEVQPKGMVPVIDTGLQIMAESVDISDYLNEQYPEPPLYPDDENKRKEDKSLITEFGELTSLFSKVFYDLESKTLSEYLEPMKMHLLKYDNVLKKRGGVYFGGDKPCMVDYMLYPWAPRAHVLKLIYNQEIPSDADYPCLYAWCKAMSELREVRETATEVERLYKLNRQYAAGPQAVDFDSI